MVITPRDTGILDLRPVSPRDPGPCHVSNIIRDIEHTLWGKKRPYDELSPSEKVRMGNYTAGGWAWEEILREGLIRAGIFNDLGFVSPGEMEMDGVYGNPDGFSTESWRVMEFKATWRSSNRPLEPDFQHWLWQIMAYCRMCRTNGADLYVFFVNGDYRDSGPQYKSWQLDFTDLEIDENWQMLINHARSKGWLPIPNRRQASRFSKERDSRGRRPR